MRRLGPAPELHAAAAYAQMTHSKGSPLVGEEWFEQGERRPVLSGGHEVLTSCRPQAAGGWTWKTWPCISTGRSDRQGRSALH